MARTLLDLAALVPGYELRKAIGEAEVLRLFDRAAMGELLQRSRGRRGVATLRCAISELNPKLGFTRSQLERRFLGLCERAMLPLPIVNLPIGLAGGEVVGDFVWRDRRLIVEADGRRFHDTRVAFEADRRRDQRLTLAGWRVIRCTWRQVVDEPDDLVRVIRGLLASS